MSDPVQPHRRQPTRLPRPWDSPGKNTGVGCHFLLQCMKVKSEREVSQSCLTQRPHGLQPIRLLHPWDFPGKSTGVGCHCLLRCLAYICVNQPCLGCVGVAHSFSSLYITALSGYFVTYLSSLLLIKTTAVLSVRFQHEAYR